MKLSRRGFIPSLLATLGLTSVYAEGKFFPRSTNYWIDVRNRTDEEIQNWIKSRLDGKMPRRICGGQKALHKFLYAKPDNLSDDFMRLVHPEYKYKLYVFSMEEQEEFNNFYIYYTKDWFEHTNQKYINGIACDTSNDRTTLNTCASCYGELKVYHGQPAHQCNECKMWNINTSL